MTEKSASVGLLLATALLIKVPHRRSSLLSAAEKVPSLEEHMNAGALIKANRNSFKTKAAQIARMRGRHFHFIRNAFFL